MKKEDFDAIKVGTELRSMSGACTERYRVIELGAHGQHTTLSLGTPGLKPYKWYSSLLTYDFTITSQPPVEVGDEFTNGMQVWRVTACTFTEVIEVIEPVKEAKPAAKPARKPGHSWAALDAAWNKLGPNARELLADIAERLVKGKEHGDFEKALDWNREAYEEDLDGIVYRAMKLRSAA